MTRIIRPEPKDRLPIIGHIRIGEKDEKGFPHSLDYFKATGDYADKLYDTLRDKKPSTLGIVFLSDDDSFSCSERFEIWVDKRLYAYGDGKEFHVADGKGNFLLSEDKIKVEQSAQKINKSAKWRQVVKLRFAILGFKQVFGVWQLITQAEESSNLEIISSYDAVKRATGGRIIGIPFDLKVEMVTSAKYGSKSRYPVLSLVASQSYENLNRIRELIDAGKELRGLIDNNFVNTKLIEAPAPPAHSITAPAFLARLSKTTNIEGFKNARVILETNKGNYTEEDYKKINDIIALKLDHSLLEDSSKPFDADAIKFEDCYEL